MDWLVKRANNVDVEREHLNKILQEIRSSITSLENLTGTAGTAGNPTFALANDLAALEGLASTGLVARTGTDTWSVRTLTGPAAGITVTNGNGVSGNPTLALANDLAAVEALSTTGYAKRTGSDTWSLSTTIPSSDVVAPGSNKQVIFNDGGVLGTEAGFEYDKATDTLTLHSLTHTNNSSAANWNYTTPSGTVSMQWLSNGISGQRVTFTIGSKAFVADGSTGALTWNSNTVWHAGNGGTGSGLDADLLRGTTPTAAGLALLDDADAAAQRTTLGMGTIATQGAGAVAITGGAINGTTVGATTPSTGAFTTLSTTSFVSIGNALNSHLLRVGAGSGLPLFVYGGDGAATASTGVGVAEFLTNTTQSLAIGGSSSTPYAMWLQTRQLNPGYTGSTFPIALNPIGGNVGIGNVAPSEKLHVTGNVLAVGSIKSNHATNGIGYATGAGGTVTQATNKSTGVTLNKACGEITMDGAALAAATIVSFTLTNSAIANTDVLVLNHSATGTFGAYTLNAACGSGSATITVRNNTAGSLSEAIKIRFAVIKGVTS